MPKYKLNVVRDVSDHRDIMAAMPDEAQIALIPDDFTNSPHMPPVYDQGQEGSCTGNGWAGLFDFARGRLGLPFMSPSRQFIYGEERRREGDFSEDAGAQVRTGGLVLVDKGVPPEALFPYNILTEYVDPGVEVYAEAKKHRANVVHRVANLNEAICAELAAGFPVVMGFDVYTRFEGTGPGSVAQTGKLELPHSDEQRLGGHCVVICDYHITQRGGPHHGSLGPLLDAFFGKNQLDGYYLVRNSWGAGWGQGGYFTMPFGYVSHRLVSDCWSMRGLTTG